MCIPLTVVEFMHSLPVNLRSKKYEIKSLLKTANKYAILSICVLVHLHTEKCLGLGHIEKLVCIAMILDNSHNYQGPLMELLNFSTNSWETSSADLEGARANT